MTTRTDAGETGTIAAEGPNAEQIRYWNEDAGPTWVEEQDAIDGGIAPLGLAAIERAAVQTGERVLDVGCGCGPTTLELARRVGPSGTVVGVDLSGPMLARARAAAGDAGLTNVRFENADVQTHRFAPPPFDLAFSRFGVMFFADPQAAFANLLGALRPGGRLAFICWQPIEQNPWVLVPLQAVLAHVPPPEPPAPGAPGPFSLGDPERVRAILTAAGFADVAVTPHPAPLNIAGGDLERAADFLMRVGPAASLTRECDDATRARVAASIREALAAHRDADGVGLASACWIVTARRSEG